MAQKGFIRTDSQAPVSPLLTCRLRGRAYGFRLLTAHYGERREGRSRQEAEHAHRVYHLVLFTRGENRFLLQGQPMPSRPGTLVLTRPDEPHTFAPIDSGVTEYHEVTFELSCGAEMLGVAFGELLGAYAGVRLPPLPATVALPPDQRRTLEALYARLLDRLEERGPLVEFRSSRVVLEMLAFLITEVCVPGAGGEPPAIAPLQAAKEYIEAHYAEAFSLGDLARRAHCSPAHFCRAFKAVHGIPPIAHQLRTRIAAAQRLLAVSNLRCKEIAARLGFADSYCFSKAFRKITGDPPTRWRRTR